MKQATQKMNSIKSDTLKYILQDDEDIKKLLNKENETSKILLNSKKPIIIIGESALELKSAKFILQGIKKFLKENNFINENWNAFNVLLQNASSVGAIDLGFFEKDNQKQILPFLS